MAGLLGSGRTEIARLMFGVERADSGSATVDGKPVRLQSPRTRSRHGFGYCPEDRKTEGIFADYRCAKTSSGAAGQAAAGSAAVNRDEQDEIAGRFIRLLDIRAAGAGACRSGCCPAATSRR